MKQTIAIFFTLLFCLGGINNAMADNAPPSQDEIGHLVINYYNNQGEWAGVFRIGTIERIKIEQRNPVQMIAHVRYDYIPIPGNYKGRTDTGHDQRAFFLIRNDHRWQVVRMGKYMSAQF